MNKQKNIKNSTRVGKENEMKKIKISDDTLVCPLCGDNHLHMGYVDTYIRDSEDNEKGTHVKVHGHDIEANDSMYGNPCERRDGVTISFTCESCNNVSFLSLGNRQGETKLGWFHGYQEQV